MQGGAHSCRVTADVQPSDLTWPSLTEWQPSDFQCTLCRCDALAAAYLAYPKPYTLTGAERVAAT